MQRCKKVWTCYNRLSFGPLENLSTEKESLVSHRRLWNILQPQLSSLCLSPLHTFWRYCRCLGSQHKAVLFAASVSLCLCWPLLEIPSFFSLNGWSPTETQFSFCPSRAYLWTTSVGFLALNFLLGSANRRHQQKNGGREVSEIGCNSPVLIMVILFNNPKLAVFTTFISCCGTRCQLWFS